MTHSILDHGCAKATVNKLVGQYLASGVPIGEIDMDGFREQLADQLVCQMPATMREDYTVRPEDVFVRILVDVGEGKAHIEIGPVPIVNK